MRAITEHLLSTGAFYGGVLALPSKQASRSIPALCGESAPFPPPSVRLSAARAGEQRRRRAIFGFPPTSRESAVDSLRAPPLCFICRDCVSTRVTPPRRRTSAVKEQLSWPLSLFGERVPLKTSLPVVRACLTMRPDAQHPAVVSPLQSIGRLNEQCPNLTITAESGRKRLQKRSPLEECTTRSPGTCRTRLAAPLLHFCRASGFWQPSGVFGERVLVEHENGFTEFCIHFSKIHNQVPLDFCSPGAMFSERVLVEHENRFTSVLFFRLDQAF